MATKTDSEIVAVIEGCKPWVVVEGDSAEVLKTMPDDSVHSVVTDPPASISFMGKRWDSDRGGRGPWTEWLSGIMREALRVCKPGAWALVWALPRRSHWTAMAVEDAGWEIRDIFHAAFGTGMPKGFIKSKQWPGRGTGLKPVIEHWIIARKPFKGSTAANLDQHGTGAFHIDACRVGTGDDTTRTTKHSMKGGNYGNHEPGPEIACGGHEGGRYPPHVALIHSPGCVLVGTRKVKTGKAHRGKGGGVNFGSETKAKPKMADMTYADQDGNENTSLWACVPGCPVRSIDEQALAGGMHGAGVARGGGLGTGANASTFRGQGRPDASNGTRYGDQGGPSRFWPTFRYVPKPSSAEKNKGCEDMPARDWREGTKSSTPCSGQLLEHVGRKGKPRPNNHNTVKPVALMRWLIRLTTIEGGIVLDPFNGSGTTGVAAVLEGARYIGIEGGDENSPYYCEVSRRRIGAEKPRRQVKRRDQDMTEVEVCDVEDCGLPVRETPSGVICENGHGGAPTRFEKVKARRKTKAERAREEKVAALNLVSLRLFESKGSLEALVRDMTQVGLVKGVEVVRSWQGKLDEWSEKIHRVPRRKP